jgi:hypothetical protein
MANKNYDLSDLGASKSEDSYDLSDLGATIVVDKSISKPTKRKINLFSTKGGKEYISSPEDLSNMLEGGKNVLKGYANLLPGVNYQKNLNKEAQEAEQGIELATFFLPTGVLKAAKAIPYIGNALKSTVKSLEMRPIWNALAKFSGATAEGALGGAVASSSKEEQGENALFGADLSGGLNIASQLLFSNNPIKNALIKPLKGITNNLGLTGKAGTETLEHISQSDITPNVLAANRLRTPISPAEASGNPFVGGIEGKYSRTGEAAAEKTRIKMERVVKEKEAINDLLNTIYDKSTPEASKSSKEKIQKLYKQFTQWNLKPEVLKDLKKDLVIEDAFNIVQKDPAYRRKLQGISENNYAYLNQVKRAIGDMEENASKDIKNSAKATEFKEARKELVALMDEHVPSYRNYRQEAQKSIIRSNIEKAMKKKELKGSTFFNAILKNDSEFNKLRNDLKNVPEAQDMLDDMKLAWKNLINLEKPSGSAFRAESGLSQSRNLFSKIVDIYNEMTGGKRNVKALKFIHSPDWDKEFVKMQSIKDGRKRAEELANLLSRLTTSATVSNK